MLLRSKGVVVSDEEKAARKLSGGPEAREGEVVGVDWTADRER
jgi:hypothetical protein